MFNRPSAHSERDTRFDPRLLRPGVQYQPLSQAQREGRIKESIAEVGVQVMNELYRSLNARGVPASEIAVVELLDGYIVNIPCIDRKVIYRNGAGCPSISVITEDSFPGGLVDEEAMRVLKRLIVDSIMEDGKKAESGEVLKGKILSVYPASGDFTGAYRTAEASEMGAVIKEMAVWYGLRGNPFGDASLFQRLVYKIYFDLEEVRSETTRERGRSHVPVKPPAGRAGFRKDRSSSERGATPTTQDRPSSAVTPSTTITGRPSAQSPGRVVTRAQEGTVSVVRDWQRQTGLRGMYDDD